MERERCCENCEFYDKHDHEIVGLCFVSGLDFGNAKSCDDYEEVYFRIEI
ncbi:MAG: hypothetical protein ACRC1T_09535 [Clostridium chrysemydis]